jgi:hypothetical protein
MTQEPQAGEGEEQERSRAVLRRALVICVVLACAAGVALTVVFAFPARAVPAAARPGMLVEGLLVLLFIAATIIGLGVQWTAAIIAARRYVRRNPYPAALVVAVSQCMIFALYLGVVGFVLYFRLRAGGAALALIPAVASILAGLYFLRLPDFLTKGLYSDRQGHSEESRGG